VKLALFAGADDGEASWAVDVAAVELGPDRVAGIERSLREAPIAAGSGGAIEPIEAVGHRIVHGAGRFEGAIVVDDEVEAAIAAIADLAPLHNQAGLDGIAAARRVVGPAVPQVAVFDTAFHRTIPDAAAAYGGPREWLDRGLRRYGFHGISHAYCAGRAAAMLGRSPEQLRLVTCHLGGGCSLAAVDGGRSVDTTMGLTPLDGLVMETRSGAVDPGLVLHLLRNGSTVDEVDDVLEKRSGLLGLSGVSADLRAVAAARDDGDDGARLAIDVFVHRVASGVGAMVSALGGLDALVFTGGIGENSTEVRQRVADRFAFLGVDVDDEANRNANLDRDVSSPEARVRVLVVQAREELAIARAVRALGLR
jgi:acetate kinase